jgi:DNA-binding protein YbaB
VEIDPGAIQDGGVEMLQDLVLAACNDALEKSRKLALDRLGPLSANFG